jgi:hypothetical protein
VTENEKADELAVDRLCAQVEDQKDYIRELEQRLEKAEKAAFFRGIPSEMFDNRETVTYP